MSLGAHVRMAMGAPLAALLSYLPAALILLAPAHAEETGHHPEGPPFQLRLDDMGSAMRIAQADPATPVGSAPGSAAENTQLALRMARERLSNGSPDWTDRGVEIAHQFGARKSLVGSFTDSSRFGLVDSTAMLEGYYPLGERLTGNLAASASGTHHVLPRSTLYGQLAYALEAGWGVLGGIKQSVYNTTTVNVADLTLERYFRDYRAAFTVLPAHSQTAGNATSYRMVFGYYYGDENRVQALFARGTEVDRPTGVDVVLATQVRSTALFGRHWIGRAFAFDYGMSRTVQGSVTRNGLNAGLRYRF